MKRPATDMTKTKLTREQMLALFKDDEALRTLLQTTVKEVREGEMDEALGAGKNERTANAQSGELEVVHFWRLGMCVFFGGSSSAEKAKSTSCVSGFSSV